MEGLLAPAISIEIVADTVADTRLFSIIKTALLRYR